MLTPDDLDRKEQALCQLAQEKFGVSAQSAEGAMRKIGRRVPKRLQEQARVFTDALARAQHPKLRMMTDQGAVEAAYRDVMAHLKKIDPKDRRNGLILSTAAMVVFNLIAVATLLVIVLVQRGFL
ncbi:hypothetical protein [Shimia biformata]|uniref:hypothetical protein n=1 Tax=Shimia biformata TaxID=1294299 RepID=UPI001950CD7F|nr:hypothetical protein [Shimia biformata]